MSGGLFSMLWDRVRPMFGAASPPANSPAKLQPQQRAKPKAAVRAKRPPAAAAPLESLPTLFDLARPPLAPPSSSPALRRPPPKRVAPRQDPATAIVRTSVPTNPAKPAKSGKAGKPAPMQDRYDTVVRAMLAQYGIKVRKWRKNMSGVAYLVTYKDGSQARFLESPKPKGPMSMAVFLHEIGHHAIGFNVYRPRCLEEFHAWRWSLEAMNGNNLPITDSVRYRVARSLHYAVGKANRRGIKEVPAELAPYLERPMKPVKPDKYGNS